MLMSGLPGFLGWDGEVVLSPSKPQAASNSVRSFDGAVSLHSSVSQSFNRGHRPRPDNPNVAGYLKRYHEDFTCRPSDTTRNLAQRSRALVT